MDLLIAEDVLLLLLDDDTGKLPATLWLDHALGGAVLIDLVLREGVWVEDQRSRWSTPKVHARPEFVSGDPVLAAAHELVAAKPRSATDLVGRLAKGQKKVLTARLVERGLVRYERSTSLGFIPTERWPAVDRARESELRGTLDLTLTTGTSPDPRSGAIIAILSAADLAHQVITAPALSAREIRKRAATIAEADWAATAVREAISAMNAAIVGAVVASTVTATTAGS